MEDVNIKWEVRVNRQSEKAIAKLPRGVKEQFIALLLDMRFQGPVRGNWKNYSKLSKDIHHCHIKKGHPTYVCCWRSDPRLRVIEVFYVGTHEKAPY